jgi:hypothetical protein
MGLLVVVQWVDNSVDPTVVEKVDSMGILSVEKTVLTKVEKSVALLAVSLERVEAALMVLEMAVW